MAGFLSLPTRPHLFRNELSAHIANESTAGTRHLIAALALVELARAGGALSQLGFGHRILHLLPGERLALLFDFIASQRDVGIFPAFATRLCDKE